MNVRAVAALDHRPVLTGQDGIEHIATERRQNRQGSFGPLDENADQQVHHVGSHFDFMQAWSEFQFSVDGTPWQMQRIPHDLQSHRRVIVINGKEVLPAGCPYIEHVVDQRFVISMVDGAGFEFESNRP